MGLQLGQASERVKSLVGDIMGGWARVSNRISTGEHVGDRQATVLGGPSLG